MLTQNISICYHVALRRRGVPLAFFEPPSNGATMAVVPVAYPPQQSNETPAYQPTGHNIYQPILYTSEQYNPTAAPNGQVPQYINYPVGYTYPYNGKTPYTFIKEAHISNVASSGFKGATAYPYWGQMAYYVPQPVQTPAATPVAAAPNHPATPTVTTNPIASQNDGSNTPSWRKPDISRYMTSDDSYYLYWFT